MKYANSILDWWTLIHLGTGVGLGLTKISRPYAYSLLIGFELLENFILRKELGDFFKEIEGPVNVISDITAGIGGYEITRYISSPSQK